MEQSCGTCQKPQYEGNWASSVQIRLTSAGEKQNSRGCRALQKSPSLPGCCQTHVYGMSILAHVRNKCHWGSSGYETSDDSHF